MPFTNYAKNKMGDHMFRNTVWTKPTNTYFSLHSSTPNVSGTPSNEIVAAWYNRKQPAGTPKFNTATTSGITNNGIIQFDTVTGSAVTVSSIGMYDAPTGGNLLFYKDLPSPRLFGLTSAPFINDLEFQLTLSGMFSNYAITRWLEHVTGITQFPTITTPYFALFQTNPTPAATGTEFTGGAYARQLMEFDAAVGGVNDNTNDETFAVATANLGTANYWAIYDSLGGGNMLIFGAVTSPLSILSGDTYKAISQTIISTIV